MTKAKDPTQAELQEVFEIRDGGLFRKEYVDSWGRKQGGFVENVTHRGNKYCRVRFKGRMIYYHRIFRILVDGCIKDGKQIDHLDGNPLNNDISNLVPKNHRGNCQNKRTHRERLVCGVCWHKASGKWRAYILVDAKIIHLGYFDTELEAFDAYIQANRDHGFPVDHLLEMRAKYVERTA